LIWFDCAGIQDCCGTCWYMWYMELAVSSWHRTTVNKPSQEAGVVSTDTAHHWQVNTVLCRCTSQH